MTSNNQCGTIDFKEGFLQKENNVVNEIKSEIQSLKENFALDDLKQEVASLKSRFTPEVEVSRQHGVYHKQPHRKGGYRNHEEVKPSSEMTCDPELHRLQNEVMNKISSLEKRLSQPKTTLDSKMTAAPDVIMEKLCNIEKNVNRDFDCAASRALKADVMRKIEKLESRMSANNSDDVLMKLATLEKKVDEHAECNEHENMMKQQVFEKLAKLENHFKLKAEIPVVSKEALHAELQKLDKLMEMKKRIG